VRFKALASNSSTQGHVFATLGIVQEHDLKPADIAEVHIKAPLRESKHTTTASKKYARNAESADHSAFFANAMVIKERAFGPRAVRSENFTDPVVLDLIERITVEADPTLTGRQGASEIVTKDGRRFSKRVLVPHGIGNDPLTDKELERKFTENCAPYMDDRRVGDLIDACWNVDRLDDLGRLTELTVFPKR
jgi:2-methylcitrate dehydratase